MDDANDGTSYDVYGWYISSLIFLVCVDAGIIILLCLSSILALNCHLYVYNNNKDH